MTRRDFEAIARAMARARPPEDRTEQTIAWHRCRRHIADALAELNPAFDRMRFYRATEADL